ncbi:type II secretion system protein N [Chiayiivirga flava]|uniref:General secretion pathway protein C n=1 Tax=Chiayiivirga flava TaxID=659595 RepID=A0A7W8FZE3_9GAMM|nr:type II secretion system protein N [Chiayiivirga flava]MBB5208041.1 general secretion pathway protein C [Chiayiivirga flava]
MFDALASDAFGRRSALLARAALALAFAGCAFALVKLAWLFVAGPTLPAVAPIPLDAPSAGSAQPAQSVAAWHLFGSTQGTVDLAALAREAPATALNLLLRGTLNENAPEGGIAIIAEGTNPDQAYRVGDTLPGGARLDGIYAGRVLLSRNGTNESLSLPGESAAQTRTAPGAQTRGAGSNASGGRRTALPGAAAPAVPFINPTIAVGAPSLESIRTATGVDAAELAKDVQIMPVLENGRMAGVRLAAGRNAELLSRAGLLPTDVVTAVNGIPLDGPERGAQLLSNLQNARSAQVTVRRDGKEIQLTIGL